MAAQNKRGRNKHKHKARERREAEGTMGRGIGACGGQVDTDSIVIGGEESEVVVGWLVVGWLSVGRIPAIQA